MFPVTAGNKTSYIYLPNGGQWFLIGSSSADPVMLESYASLGVNRWLVPQSSFNINFMASGIDTGTLGGTISLQSDFSNATTTFTDVTDFLFPMKSGFKYEFKLWAITNNTGGSSDIRITVGGSPTIYGKGLGAATNGQLGERNGAYITASPFELIALDNNVTNGCIHLITGFIEPSIDGNAQVQIRDRITPGTSILKAGSSLSWNAVN